MRAELKHIDKKFTEQGATYYAETVEEDIPEQVNWWSKFALCLVRQMGGDHKNPHVTKTSLQVNSQHLKDILKETVEKYPGVSFATQQITIDKPYHVLFHYRTELEDAGSKLEKDSEASQHLNLLLEFIEDEFEDQIEEAENLLPEGLVTYDNLWTIFKPSTILVGPVHGQPRAFKLNSYQYNYDPAALFLVSL